MQIQADCDELCIYNIIPRATAKRAIPRDILKILQINKKEILKNVYVTHRKARNKKGKQNTEITNQKQKIKYLT